MENKIAVIIPAYKDTYLLNTLISINNQTDKKFNLYICNDSSPYNIEKVLADFKKINKIHFEYINPIIYFNALILILSVYILFQ